MSNNQFDYLSNTAVSLNSIPGVYQKNKRGLSASRFMYLPVGCGVKLLVRLRKAHFSVCTKVHTQSINTDLDYCSING